MMRWLRFSLVLCVVSLSWAAPSREIAPGLPYFRIADLAKDTADLQSALTSDSVVLDLRSATGSADAAAALALRLEQPRPAGRGVRLILVNPGTAAEIVAAVSRPHPRQLTIGPSTPALAPDIAVTTSVEDDRRAYEALASGTPLEKLLSSNLDKKRFDEAALARTRANAAAVTANEHDADDPDPGEVEPATPPATEKKATPAPPVTPHDLVLERAAQIYRALLAIKK